MEKERSDDMKKKQYDAIIIGAGYGGVTIAAVLTQKGFKVLVIDKNKTAGGMAMRHEKNGETYEFWPIVVAPARGSRFDDLIRLLGLDVEDLILIPDRGTEFVHISKSGECRKNNSLNTLLGQLGVKPWKQAGFLVMALISGLMPLQLVNRKDNVPLSKWIKKFRLPKAAYGSMGWAASMNWHSPLNRLPASQFIRWLKGELKREGLSYIRHGMGHIAEQAMVYIKNNGSDYLASSRVEEIIIKEGHACGVSTNKGDFFAPIIISNAGIQPTVLKLVNSNHFTPVYLNWVRNLEPSMAGMGVRYHLSKPVFTSPVLVVFGDDSWLDDEWIQHVKDGEFPEVPMIYIVVPALFDKELSTSPNQVALMSTFGFPDPESPLNEEIIKKMEDTIAKIWPDIPGAIVDRSVYTSKQVSSIARDHVMPGQGGECMGLAKVMGQSGRSEPNARSPIPGLYYVGADTGGDGVGTVRAVDSGFNVAKMVMDDYQGLFSWFEQNPQWLTEG